MPDVAVTRATGYVGGQTARELAVAGIETLFLVPAAEHPRRIEQHRAAVASGA